MKNILFLLFYICLITSFNPTKAQVTIGVDEDPSEGAILDLKEIPNVKTTSVNSFRGLGLPRVQLTNLTPTSATELSQSIGGKGEWDMNIHIGLTVYNVLEVPCKIGKGIYVWNGKQWEGLGNTQAPAAKGSYESDLEAIRTILDNNPDNLFGLNRNSTLEELKEKCIGFSKICGEDRITTLFLPAVNIKTLAGIENLPMLDSLIVPGNTFTEVDLSHNTNLTHVYIESNISNLQKLNIKNCTLLETLECGDAEQLTELDLTTNINLKYLNLNNNINLANIDVSNCPKLESLFCNRTKKFTKLDVSKNPELVNLVCSAIGTIFTTLDVSNNPKLKSLRCDSNGITTLDVSNNPELAELNCYFNKLTTLDISNNLKLTKLICNRNYLSQIEVNNFKRNNPNYCNISTRTITYQYKPGTTTNDTSITAPTCP